MNPIVMVANFSGNVGKTTLTKNLLMPNMPGVRIFAVEDVNAGYNQGEAVQLSAEQTQSILEQVIEASLTSPVLVDVGASNVSNFFAAMTNYEGMSGFISKVVVPTEPSEKVQTDTLSTLRYLIDELDFSPDDLLLVLNKVPGKVPVEVVFGELEKSANALGVTVRGHIPESDTFQIANNLGKTIVDLASLNPKELHQASQMDQEMGMAARDNVRLMLAAASAKKLKKRLDDIFGQLGLSDL